ncbi:probable E3 ubiquitin-protein ligase RHC1A [Oryza brachyantha]|uniref:RING-type E3 ubiquitin transferase n=1 Tax=Oryza brachyantha TaxID=4533 RepID=J3L4Z5_ORYBR|nr:probable E3 ubiquitin-protein ligase RHC1A [Oryza brachyantha]
MPNRATHWCYACRRPIRIRGQDMTCPNCNDGFIQEISEMGGMLNTYGIFDPSFDERRVRSFGMVEAMSALMRQRMAEMGGNRVLDFHGMRGASSHQRRQPAVRSMLIFGSNTPAHVSSSSEEAGVLRRGRRIGSDRPNFSRFLVGPSLEALFEQLLLHNNHQGPPPAPQSAIDSMPVVKINLRHLRDDPHCPVCTDKFEVGTEAREMPCKHLYHADCIIPWLVQHNSCPVCRHPLPSSSRHSGSTRSSSTHSNEAVSHGVAGSNVDHVARSDDSRNHESPGSLSFLWPFDSPTPDSSSYMYEGGVGAGAGEPTVHDDAGQMTYSEWHYDY